MNENFVKDFLVKNEEIFKNLKEAFKEYLKDYGKIDTIHIKFDKQGNFLETKKAIIDNFDKTFLGETFNKDYFTQWWDKSINSARMKGNATNLLKDEKSLLRI